MYTTDRLNDLTDSYDFIDLQLAADVLRDQDIRGGVWSPQGHGPDADESVDTTGEG
jgi:hypothetical protein